MAHHLSAKKRMRQDAKKRLQNRYHKKSTRTAIAKLRSTSDSSEAKSQLPRVVSMIDRLAKRNLWHKNKAANVKSKLQKYVTSLAQ